MTSPLQLAAPNLVYSQDIYGLVVSWVARTDETLEITKYSIGLYRLDGMDIAGTTIIEVDATGNLGPFTLDITNGLTPGTSYKCMVVAYAGDDNFSPMSETSGTVLVPGVPNAPTITSTFLNTSTNNVEITWTAPSFNGGSTITGYNIYRVSDDSFIATTSQNTAFFNVESYTPVYIEANNSVGNSAASGPSASIGGTVGWTNGINDTTGGPYDESGYAEDGVTAYMPTAVASVTATTTGYNVLVEWPASSSGGNGLEYIITTNDGQTGVNLTTNLNFTFIYTSEFASGKTGITYSVSTRLVSRINVSASTSSETVSNTINFILPNPPTNLVATINVDTHSIDFTWDAPVENGSGAITRYDICGETSGVNNSLTNAYPPDTSISVDYTIKIIPFTRFYISSRIIIVGGDLVSEPSALSEAIVIPVPTGPLPATPKILPPVLGDLTITLNWTAASPPAVPVTSYKVTRSDNDIVYESTEGGSSGTCTIDTDLIAGTPITFTVSSVNANGECLVPASIIVTPITTPDPPAQFVAYVGKLAGTVFLYWIPPSPTSGGTPVTGYVLTYNGIVINLGPTVLTFFDNVAPEQGITFTLVSKNKIGISTELSADIFEGGDVTGV